MAGIVFILGLLIGGLSGFGFACIGVMETLKKKGFRTFDDVPAARERR